ncbi:MAG TPA: hypothetical protein ENK48_04495 [Gammaproteobacteria bacterium]|nr:hypothetical protein [Gammaproteobacteria bacterium]
MIHSSRTDVLPRALEVSLYALAGALLVGQVFLGEAAVTTGQALMVLSGEALLSLVATGSAPLVGLLRAAERPEERGRVIPFRLRIAGQRDEDQRRAA